MTVVFQSRKDEMQRLYTPVEKFTRVYAALVQYVHSIASMIGHCYP